MVTPEQLDLLRKFALDTYTDGRSLVVAEALGYVLAEREEMLDLLQALQRDAIIVRVESEQRLARFLRERGLLEAKEESHAQTS